MELDQSKLVKIKNYKLSVYTCLISGVFAFSAIGIAGCKWNSDYRSRIIQANPENKPLSMEESALQDKINEVEPDSLKSAVPTKPLPSVPDLPNQ